MTPHIIWQYGLIFGKNEDECLMKAKFPYDESILYVGEIDNLLDETASKVAEIHPDFEKYYEDSAATLYKGYCFELRNGTESPVLAIKSLNKINEGNFVIIWKITED